MIIGEQNFISPKMRNEFMTTGTVHIISISGSHLGLLSFLSFFLVKGISTRLPSRWLEFMSRKVTPTRLAVLMTIPLVIFYTFLAGGEVATVRSLLMILLFLLTVWIGHARDLLGALGIAAGIAVLHDPQTIFDVSFQLSYLSVLALACVVHQDIKSAPEDILENTWIKKFKAWLRQ